MAKINIEVDTSEKTIRATVNGQVVDNVVEVWGFREVFSEGEDPAFHASVTTRDVIDDSTNRIVRFVSAEAQEARAAINDGVAISNDKFPGMVGIPDKTKAQKDIESYIAQ